MAKIDKNDNNYIYYWVGKNIRKYRKQNGWTQKELAKNIENETFKNFSLNTLYHISKVLGVHIKLLFEDLDEEQKK